MRISRARAALLQDSAVPWKSLSAELRACVDLDTATEVISGTVVFAALDDEVVIVEVNNHRVDCVYFTLGWYAVEQDMPVLIQFLLSKGITIFREDEVFDE